MTSDFKSSTVCRANRFFDNILNMPMFKPKFNFLKILKAILVKNPKRVMTISFFSRYFDFIEPKS